MAARDRWQASHVAIPHTDAMNTSDISPITFDARLVIGGILEQRVTAELADRGWTVTPWGQGAWPEQVRAALARTDSDLRWIPDLVAARGRDLALIDCKNTLRARDGDGHSVSRRCLRAARKIGAEFDLPVYYVFDTLGVLTPDEVMLYQRVSTLNNAPSYLFISRSYPRPFDDIFGLPLVGLAKDFGLAA